MLAWGDHSTDVYVISTFLFLFVFERGSCCVSELSYYAGMFYYKRVVVGVIVFFSSSFFSIVVYVIPYISKMFLYESGWQ